MEFEAPDVLVLGGGGILGEAWMAALLAGLQDATGFDARGCSHFVGTSAGSIVAAALAGGVDPRDRLGDLPEQPGDPDEDVEARPRNRRFGIGAAAIAPIASVALRSTAFGGAMLRRAALGRIPHGSRSLSGLGRWVDGLGLAWDGRLRVTTVEVETGRRVVFGDADAQHLSVARAVEASCAIPGVFRPVSAAGRTYVDGGAWSLTNLDVAPVGRGTRVLCLNPTGSLTAAASVRGALGPLSRSVATVEALALQRHGATVTTLSPDAAAANALGPNFMDPGRRGQAQEAGYRQGLRAGRDLEAAA
jgi:NTE family protein